MVRWGDVITEPMSIVVTGQSRPPIKQNKCQDAKRRQEQPLKQPPEIRQGVDRRRPVGLAVMTLVVLIK